MKFFIILLMFSSFSFSDVDENTTIVCLLDGVTDEKGNSRNIKLQQLVTFNEFKVITFKNEFLTDYDFLEGDIWSHGLKSKDLRVSDALSENEITISIRSSEQYQRDGNLTVNWIIWDLIVNRKSGIATVRASYAYTIDNTSIGLDKEFIMISYSGFGNCVKSKNKF